jgi:uncharacterized protein YndB with AHSA1/START domain
MTTRERYAPGQARGARIHKQSEQEWTLVLVRDLKHPPARVWDAITDPAQLREWAPFDADRSLGAVGPMKLTTMGAPKLHVTDNQVKRAEKPKLLEYTWGDQDMRWELEPLPSDGTRLTLWANINRMYISMGATGWHICFDVLDGLLAGEPLGRIVGPDAMKLPGWQQLHEEYAKQLGVPMPKW